MHNAATQPAKVLLIEDSEAYRFIIHDTLIRQSPGRFQLTSAQNLAEGLRLLRQSTPDVILLDLGLPETSGFLTFQRIQAAAPKAPIIILTAVDDETLAMRAVREGAQDFIVKEDASRETLTRAIRYAIERNRTDQSLRELSGRLLKVQDDERRRIARELHDVTAQNLAALGMNLAQLQTLIATQPSRAQTVLADCRAAVEQCTSEVRTLSYLLHAPLLDELGLTDAIRDYADGFSRRSHIRVDLEIAPNFPRLTPDQELALFRILQEALSNVHRHSQSPTASVRLTVDGRSIALTVEDRGRGVPEGVTIDSALGVGLQGMRERMRQLGGRLELALRPAGGACVTATLPITTDSA